METSSFFDLIEKHFLYLVDEDRFSVVKRKRYDSFDNTEIVLQSQECRIRVLRERGQVFVEAGPLLSTEEWYDLATLIAYLTRETEELNYEIPDYSDYDTRIEWQVKRLAGILKIHYVQICELFRKKTFNKDLKKFINSRLKKRWNI